MTSPTPPIELTGTRSRWPTAVDVPASVLAALASIAPVSTAEDELAEGSRDWWPLALHWSLDGEVPCRAAAIVRPDDDGAGRRHRRAVQRPSHPA